MKIMIEKSYDILLDDRKADEDYTEWNRVYWNLVYWTSAKVSKKLSELFDCIWTKEYKHKNWVIIFRSKTDKELPNKPLCFWTISVKWHDSIVQEIHDILIQNFEEIDKHSS